MALALLVVGALVSLPWLVHSYHEANKAVNDAALYLHVAKAFLAGDGFSYLGRPFTVHPPGMPLLIAPVLAWRGLDFYALNWLVSASGVLLIALFFALIRPRLGPWLAFLVAALAWLNPALRRFSNQVMTDVPGAALLIASLLIERWASRKPSLARELALGASIALAAHFRTVSILLVPAILAARALAFWSTRPNLRECFAFATRRAAPFVLTTLALLAPWTLRNARHPPEAPLDQNFVYSYSAGMWHADPGDPSSPVLPLQSILARVPVRGSQMLSLLGSRMQTENASLGGTPVGRPSAADDLVAPTPVHWLAGACMISIALWMLARKRRASEFLLAANASLIAIYFGFQDRLVLLPFLFCAALVVEFAHGLGTRWIGARASGLACAAALLAVIAVDFKPRQGWEGIARHEREVREFCADVSRRVPADDELAASIGWHYALVLDRPVHSLLFAIRREPGAGFQKVVRKYGIDTVIGAPFTAEERAIIDMLRGLPRSQPTVHGGVIVRLRE